MELDPHHRDAHYRLPDLTGASAREVLASLVGIELDLRLLGQGRVVSQTPEPGTLVATHSQLTVQLAQP